MSFVIRRGNAEDVPGIFRLIKELADFERAPEAVINTEKALLEDGFGNNAIYQVFVAEEIATSDVIGMALYYTAYSTWKGKMFFLDDLVVTERFRKYGIGRKLINEVLRDALDKRVSLVKWQVLDWNTRAINFYKSMNATFDGEWIDCKMSSEQISAYLKTLEQGKIKTEN
ncbi:MAG: family acetyltransferase [Bacteroidota bacterium]|nr:family acetyltransferase [Bacteroidota bacterium]